jgi:hypothetical protein
MVFTSWWMPLSPGAIGNRIRLWIYPRDSDYEDML